MRKLWSRFMDDEAFASKIVTVVGRFALSAVAVLVTSKLGAPEWAVALSGAVGQLVGAGERNPK